MTEISTRHGIPVGSLPQPLRGEIERLQAENERLRADVALLRGELIHFKPEPMSQNCREGRHAGQGDQRCHGCRCLCHASEWQA